MTMNKGGAFIFLLIFSAGLITGCGGPRISTQHVNFSRPSSAEPMISAEYLIGVGDELEIMYYIDPDSSSTDYLIDTEDTLLIDFDYYPNLKKEVRVRPDGFITLSRIGDVKAVGMKPQDLAARITELFDPLLTKPDATVEVVNFNVKVEKLKAAITTRTRGESKQVTVRPDGKISLPYVHDVHVKNLTCRQISKILTEKYQRFVRSVSVATSVLHAHSHRAYIMGEVARPNFYELTGPVTLTQLVATAGGFSNYANTHQVVLIRRAEDGRPNARLIDMDDGIGRVNMESDPIIRQYDVIFVPKTKISQAALVIDSMSTFWNIIPVSFSYSLGGKRAE